MDKLLVILDLDETLVHATSRPKFPGWDFELFSYKVFRRPGLDAFLGALPEHFRVAVWSSASDDYVAKVVETIFPAGYPLEFVWGRSRCTRRIDYYAMEEAGYLDYSDHLFFIKPLKKVKKQGLGHLERMLIVDDTPFKCQKNYGNAIYPAPFTGDPADDELSHLLPYLIGLKDIPNVRTVEKRGWRNH